MIQPYHSDLQFAVISFDATHLTKQFVLFSVLQRRRGSMVLTDKHELKWLINMGACGYGHNSMPCRRIC